MLRLILALGTTCVVLVGACAAALGAPVTPPAAAIRPVVETYFGTTVTDPYRYIENLASSEVLQWARAQSEYTRATLDAIPGRAKLLARITQLEDSNKDREYDVSQARGGRVFHEKRRPSEQQAKLYVREGFSGVDRLLVDPDALPGVGPHALEFFRPSHDGRRVAWAVSAGGSEEAVIHVTDVRTGKELIEPIDRVQFGFVNWLADDSAFVYRRLRKLPAGAPDTDQLRNSGVWMHRMEGKRADTLVLGAGVNPSLPVAPDEFPAVKPLAGTPWQTALAADGSPEMALYAAPAAAPLTPSTKWSKLFDHSDAITGYAVHGDDLYLLSHQAAPRFKVLRISMKHPDVRQAHVVMAPGGEVVDAIAAAKDALYVASHEGSTGKLYRVSYAAGAQPVPVRLPAAGALEIIDADVSRPGVLVTIASWTHDQIIVSVGARDAQTIDTGLQAPGPYGAPADLVAEEVLVKSHDGIEVPLSIVHSKSLKLDGAHPAELTAYGAYGNVDAPYYLVRQLAWYELGGVWATCHVRGGGIYGEQWHLAGKEATKPNTWKDLVACAEYLVQKGYTNSSRLGIQGASAGGITVGRAMTARPDLFGAVVSDVGDLNPLRDESTATGAVNVPEFGTVTTKDGFHALLEMDAYHHVQDDVKYPATLLLQGLNDPRVPAWESLKMTARLQAASASASGKPVLLRLQMDGGHYGDTRSQRLEQAADRWSFMLWQFGDPRFQLTGK